MYILVVNIYNNVSFFFVVVVRRGFDSGNYDAGWCPVTMT